MRSNGLHRPQTILPILFWLATANSVGATDSQQQYGEFGPQNSRIVASSPAKPEKGAAKPARRITILQIGDSHTAADYFTGEVRRILQAKFGDGGPGALVAGRPHLGIRHALIKSAASRGWTFASLQKGGGATPFGLTGYSATATAARETISFAAQAEQPFSRIEIETWSGPGRGAVQVSLDDVVCLEKDLSGAAEARVILKITPAECRRRQFRDLRVTTLNDAPVTLDGVSVFERESGLTYSNIGFPGATIDIINKFDGPSLAADLRRLSPEIVVLAFGTNEGYKDDIVLNEYAAQFKNALNRLRDALPRAKFVMILPPAGERLVGKCERERAAAATCARDSAPPAPVDKPKEPATADPATAAKPESVCFWRKPPQLDAIRDFERALAQERNIPFWDWSKLMPRECGAHAWVHERRLMAGDHVHFNQDGYRFSAADFAKFLRPIVAGVK